MKNIIGRKILSIVVASFLIIFVVLSVYIAATIKQYFTNRMELELKDISDLNAAQLEARINSARMTTLSAAEMFEKIDAGSPEARKHAEDIILAMLANQFVYNAWLVIEPGVFDEKDADSPGGRFMLSYVAIDGQIIEAHDMDEETLDESLWYAVPRYENRLYVETGGDSESLYDYGVGESVYTLCIAVPIHRNGQVVGCVGADVFFDTTTFSVNDDTSIAIFHPNGKIFYTDDIRFSQDSVDTLLFTNAARIKQSMVEDKALFLSEEYCPFLDQSAFMLFNPVHSEGMGEGSFYLYVSLPKTALFAGLTPEPLQVAAAALMALLIMLIVFIYVIDRVYKPIRMLTLSADAISQGQLESEIAFFPESQGEIGILSRSLYRMVEEFRVYITKQEQTQEELSLRSMVRIAGTQDDFCELLAALGLHFDVFRVTLVLLSSGKASIAARYEHDKCEREFLFPSAFAHHMQVVELLAQGRRLVFLNSFGIKTHKLAFIGDETVSCCLVPLRDENLHGYIIFENRDRKNTFRAGSGASLIYVSDMMTELIVENKRKAQGIKNKTEPPEDEAETDEYIEIIQETDPGNVDKFIMAAMGIDGLYVNSALENMGGLADVYQQAVRLFARTAQSTTGKMDMYLSSGDIQAFAIEIHGIKGALNNIGATELGAMASRMESAAKNGDLAYCSENYTAFINALELLCEQLAAITQVDDEKEAGDAEALSDALLEAMEAAWGFDSLGAYEILSPFSAFSYDPETDEALPDIIRALEEFDCESALAEMNKMGGKLNNASKE